MPSIRSRIYRRFLSRSNIFSLDIEPMRQALERAGARSRIRKGVSSTRTDAADVPTLRLEPRRMRRGFTLLYLHGGGGCIGLMPGTVAFVSRLAEACEMRAVVPDYRVAPEHPYPAALDDALAVCAALAGAGPSERLVLAGDSFGFGLGLAALLLSPPGLRSRFELAVGFTPVVDLTGTSDTFVSRRAADPFRTKDPLQLARRYAGDEDLASPRLSPLFGALGGLPRLYLQAAEDDVFVGDAVRLAERARVAAVPVELHVVSGMWHVFQLAGDALPESKRALGEAAGIIRALC